MHEAVSATPGWAAVAYLVAGICFILALRGLSSPSSSRRGNRFGMFGMALAMLTTIYLHLNVTIIEIAIAIAIGGVIGFITARKIAMTAMPQLVAAFHRSEEHTSELQSLMRISYAVFCLKKKKNNT